MKKLLTISLVLVLGLSGCITSPKTDRRWVSIENPNVIITNPSDEDEMAYNRCSAIASEAYLKAMPRQDNTQTVVKVQNSAVAVAIAPNPYGSGSSGVNGAMQRMLDTKSPVERAREGYAAGQQQAARRFAIAQQQQINAQRQRANIAVASIANYAMGVCMKKEGYVIREFLINNR